MLCQWGVSVLFFVSRGGAQGVWRGLGGILGGVHAQRLEVQEKRDLRFSPWLFVRAFVYFLFLVCWFQTLALLPVGDAVTLVSTAPVTEDRVRAPFGSTEVHGTTEFDA